MVGFVRVLTALGDMVASALAVQNTAAEAGLRFIYAATVVLWMFFPIAWITAHLEITNLYQTEMILVFANFTAKVLFSSSVMFGSYMTIDKRRQMAQATFEAAARIELVAELRTAVERKDQFLQVMSHELRTPLNGMLGLSDLIIRGTCGEVNAKALGFIKTINKSGGQLLAMINDILDTASLKHGKLVIKHEQVDLSTIVQCVMDTVAVSNKGQVVLKADIHPDTPHIVGDSGRLTQILYNLVGNALKFTSHGSITVRIMPAGDGTHVEMAVQDTGLGIPEDKHDIIFEVFEQVDMSTTRKYGGTGLGLNIVKQLVLAHNGHIALTSQLGKGSTFTVVVKAYDGIEALEWLNAQATVPDIVLLDCMMPRMNGLEFCKKLRETVPRSLVPVIMVSAKSNEGSIVEGLHVGCNDFISKPVRREELLARIDAHLHVQQDASWMMQLVNGTGGEVDGPAMELLKTILPGKIIKRIQDGHKFIADAHDHVAVLFSDVVGFTPLSSSMATADVFMLLSNMFTAFDKLVDRYEVYKVETIGDAYMVVAGHDEDDKKRSMGRPIERMISMAKAMLDVVSSIPCKDGSSLQIRVGIHVGPAYSGVIGMKCPRYCFLGDTVNTASRMESNGFPMAIHISEAAYLDMVTEQHAKLHIEAQSLEKELETLKQALRVEQVRISCLDDGSVKQRASEQHVKPFSRNGVGRREKAQRATSALALAAPEDLIKSGPAVHQQHDAAMPLFMEESDNEAGY
ncbi:hypothetical protein WJX72_012229 [[Myrmecia] bisecta]|uniref:histidine kinase n=1 Tax=[Myrmecia] bisecta TaxID=41462 RepID=A0AAW1QGP9_9CHLO